MNAIALENVHKHYGRIQAIEDLTLHIQQGDIVCLLGANGAGKSTSLNLMLGLTKPDKGRVRLFGHAPGQQAARRRLGYVAQECDFPVNLTAREILNLVCSHYPAPMDSKALIETFGLSRLADRYVGGFSGGERRRLALAIGFAGRPDVIFLDEPTTGLDQVSRKRFWQHCQHYQNHQATMIVTTHHLYEIEAIANRVCLIDQGRLLLDGKVQEIKQKLGQKLIRFHSDAPLPPLSPVSHHECHQARHSITSPDADSVIRQLVQNDIAFSNLSVTEVSLEQAVEMLTSQSAGGSQ